MLLYFKIYFNNIEVISCSNIEPISTRLRTSEFLREVGNLFTPSCEFNSVIFLWMIWWKINKTMSFHFFFYWWHILYDNKTTNLTLQKVPNTLNTMIIIMKNWGRIVWGRKGLGLERLEDKWIIKWWIQM
jgi:hypothetical protein